MIASKLVLFDIFKMRVLLTIFCLFSILKAEAIFLHVPTKTWLGAIVKPCENKTANINDMEKWEDGNYFLNENNVCEEIVSFLDGEQKTLLADKKYIIASYNNGVVDGWKKTYFADNKIHEEEFYIDGVQEGVKKVFDEKGYLKLLETYKNGILDGQRIEYSRSGRPSKLANYKNGTKHGIERIHNIQGRPSHEFSYSNGEILPTLKRYYYNSQGDFSHVFSYENEEKEGSWLYYAKNGDILKETVYKNDKELYTKNFGDEIVFDADIAQNIDEESEVLKTRNPLIIYESEHPLIVARKVKYETVDSSNQIILDINKKTTLENSDQKYIEELEFIEFLDKDISVDSIKVFFDNNSKKWFGVDLKNKNSEQIKISSPKDEFWANFHVDKNGVLNGWYKSYHKNGALMFSIYYDDGKKQGIAKKFNNDGSLHAKWFFLDDKISGSLTLYYPGNSERKAVFRYEDDSKNGVVFYYNKNGEMYKRAKIEDVKIAK